MVRSYRVERVVVWWQMWPVLSLYLGQGLGLGLNNLFLGVWHEHSIFYTGIYFTSLKGTLISQSGWVSFKRYFWLAIKRMGARCWGFEDVSFLSWWVNLQLKVTLTKNMYFYFCLFSIYYTWYRSWNIFTGFLLWTSPFEITYLHSLCINQKK